MASTRHVRYGGDGNDPALIRGRRRRGAALAMAAAGIVLGFVDVVRADGTFIGGQVSMTESRDWLAPADPGINWNSHVAPTSTDPLDFTIAGDGSIDLDGMVHSHPSATFDDWVTYTLTGTGNTLALTSSVGTLTVKNSVSSTY